MGALYLTRAEVPQSALNQRLLKRLKLAGEPCHPRTIRRQLLGEVQSVAPRSEEALVAMLVESFGYRNRAHIEEDLAHRGMGVSKSEQESDVVSVDRARRLMDIWLQANPGQSKRALARQLKKDLDAQGVKMSFDSLLGKLTGRGKSIRKPIMSQLLQYLAPLGIRTEEDAIRYAEDHQRALDESLQGRNLVDAVRFRKLARLWQIRRREASTRRLAGLLQTELVKLGVQIGIEHLQRAISGRTPRVRVDAERVLEVLVQKTLPKDTTLEQALDRAGFGGARDFNLAWVHCAPIAELAQSWLKQNPSSSLRQLAIRIADTIRRMGYKTSHNSIQPVIGGWKKKTRGYVYRAMLKQLPGTPDRVPLEHLVQPPERTVNLGERMSAVAKITAPKEQSLKAFIKEVRRHLPEARSSHFLHFASMRAERIYGVPRSEVRARILGRRIKRRAEMSEEGSTDLRLAG